MVPAPSGRLSGLDVAVALGSIALVFCVAACGAIRRGARGAKSEAFFLAGRATPWWMVAASLFASNIGTEHFVGQAGAAALGGMAVGLYEWTAAYLVVSLGFFFAPIYLQCQLTTIPEFLEARYNRWCRGLFVLISLIAYILAKIGICLFAGAVVFEVVAGIGMWSSAPIIIIGTALYTMAGGLTAVMWTDVVQWAIFVGGGLMGTVLSLDLVGGMSGLFQKLESFGLDSFPHVLRPPAGKEYPWPGMLFGIPTVALWYWCVDQEMAQRVLSARNLSHARLGTSIAGLMKVLPPFITVVPGMVARVLFETCRASPAGGREFARWCDANLDEAAGANRAYPLLVMLQFPEGVRGVMVASFLAAMMSSLAAVFNSAATVFTYDVYLRFFREEGFASPRHLVFVGRLATAGLTLLSLLWLPVIQSNSRGVYIVAQTAMCHLAPPVSAIFVLAVAWRRANGQGALAGLLVGCPVGVAQLVAALMYQDTCAAMSSRDLAQPSAPFYWLLCLNFNYVAICLFALTTAVTVTVSYCFPPPEPHQIRGRVWEFRPLAWWRGEGSRKQQGPPGQHWEGPHGLPTGSEGDLEAIAPLVDHGGASSEVEATGCSRWQSKGGDPEGECYMACASSEARTWFDKNMGRIAVLAGIAVLCTISALIAVFH